MSDSFFANVVRTCVALRPSTVECVECCAHVISVCLCCSLVRRHGLLTKDVSSVITGRTCAPAETAVKLRDADTQSETDAVNVRHEDYGTTGTTSLQVSHRESTCDKFHLDKIQL